jgi:hypothetical protein
MAMTATVEVIVGAVVLDSNEGLRVVKVTTTGFEVI